MVGEFDKTLKRKIDDVQRHIDFLRKLGRDNLVPYWIARKNKLCAEITIIEVVCSYCKKHIGTKDGKGVTGVSHGICDECNARLKDDQDNECFNHLDE